MHILRWHCLGLWRNMNKLKISDLFLVAFESEKSIYKDILNDYAYEYKRLAYISKRLN